MTLLTLIVIALLIYFIIQKDTGRNTLLVNNSKRCPNCNNPVEDDFNVCPICKETLRTKCVRCYRTIEAGWAYCPYCEAKQQRVKKNEDY